MCCIIVLYLVGLSDFLCDVCLMVFDCSCVIRCGFVGLSFRGTVCSAFDFEFGVLC